MSDKIIVRNNFIRMSISGPMSRSLKYNHAYLESIYRIGNLQIVEIEA